MASASPSPSESFTALLARFTAGDKIAHERLVPLVYAELHRIAAQQLSKERPGHTLQPTALVNEAFLRLADRPVTDWKNKAHFLAAAAGLMRCVLVDHARARKASKRGGMAQRVTLTEPLASSEQPVVDILLVDELLEQLAGFDSRQAQIVEMHFFGGMTFEEVALVLNIAARTAKRDWTMARACLHHQLSARA